VEHAGREQGQQDAITAMEDPRLFDPRFVEFINRIDLAAQSPSPDDELVSASVSHCASAIQRKVEAIKQGFGLYLSPPMLAALECVEYNPFITILADDLENNTRQQAAIFAE